jgi:imidazolonepropionase-like amidohydrolase
MSLKHGFRAIFHADFADTEALDMLEAKKDEVFLAPAVGFIYVMTHEYDEWGVSREFVEQAQLGRILEYSCRTYAEARKRGIRVLPGGDYGINCCPQGRNARDLELFVKLYGYTPAEVLMAATKWGGEIMKMGDELGMIKPGYLADLLCVDGDPTKDIAIMQERDKILAIMKDGSFHKAPPPPARQAEAA